MADFTMLPGGGGGGQHTPSHSSKKGLGGLPKPVLYIGGAIIIAAFLYIRNMATQNATAQTNTNVDPSQVDYPTNSTDVASQLQNNNDILNGEVTSTLNQFQAQMQSDYGTQLTQLVNKMNTLQGTVDALNAHPNPTHTTAPSKTSTPAPKNDNTSHYYSGVSKVHYATPSGGFHTTTSITDFLKSKGYDAGFNSRKKIASNMGIKNYTGSASQNEAMLKHLHG